MNYKIKKIPKIKYKIKKGSELIAHRKQSYQTLNELNKVRTNIKRTLKVNRNFRKTAKTYKATKETIYKIKNKIHPKIKKKGAISSIKDATFNAIKESDNMALGSISETREKFKQGHRIIRTGIKTGKKTYRLSKKSYSVAKKTYRLSNNLYYRAHGITPIPDNKKTSPKNNKNKGNIAKKDGLLSSVKGKFVEATRVDEKSVSDSFIGAIHTFRDTKDKTEPIRKVTSAGYKYVLKPTSKFAFNKTKQLTINAAKRYQMNKLTNLRMQKRNLTRQYTSLKPRGISYNFKSNFRYSTKQSIKTTKKISRNIKSGANLILKAKAQVARTIKLITNPVFLKGAAVVLAFYFLIIIISNGIAAATAPFSFLIIDSGVALSYKEEISKIDAEFNDKITKLKNKRGYDSYVVNYMNEYGIAKTSWKDILAILAVKYEQDLKCDKNEIKTLKDLFNASNKIVEKGEIYQVPVQKEIIKEDEEGNVITEIITVMEDRKRLIIQIYSYDIEDIIDGVGFTEDEKEWARRLSTSDISDIFPDVPGLNDEPYTSEQIVELINNAPKVNIKREKIIETAVSLVGKVSYFWGGKSSAGWNSYWGKSMLVTSPGSHTTNTYQTYGLDCSGFTDWVYKTAGVGNILSGGGTSYQWKVSYPIDEGDLLPGDLAFKSSPNSGGINHVGIFLGYDDNREKLFVHCAPQTGITIDRYSGFKYWRRVYIHLEN